MKRRAIYSRATKIAVKPRPDSEQGNAKILDASRTNGLVAPLPAPASVAKSRSWASLIRDPGHRQSLAIAFLAFALGIALLFILSTQRHSPITQKSIDSAVKYSLENAPIPPSRASLAYEAVARSVVRVSQMKGEGPKAKEAGVGTGVVITQEGLIITNFHVIAGAPRLAVTFSDGSVSDADVVSADPDRDIALIKAREAPDELEPATLRSVAGLKTGDEVFAVGFPFGIGPSLSAGVVSGLDRSYVSPLRGNVLTGLIQFDAAANPGNSGGPLLDRDGDVVGLVSSILNPNEQRVFIGIAFAVPIEEATRGFALNPF